MLWNEWKYSSKKTLNLSHLSPPIPSADLMLQLSSSMCSQAEVLLEINAGDTFCDLSGTRDRAAITDDGAWGIPCAIGGLGMWQSSNGQQGRAAHQLGSWQETLSQMASHVWRCFS